MAGKAHDGKERLTEMLTVVVTPSMREWITEAQEQYDVRDYATIVRWGLGEWLKTHVPHNPEEASKR